MGIISENVSNARSGGLNGFKNQIINGNFDFWDFGTSQTTSGFGSDSRWVNGNSGSTKTHSRISSTDVERGFFNSPFFSRTVVTSVALTTNFVSKSQRIEDITKFAGKTITLSFWAKADITKNIAIEFSQNFGTGGTPSAAVNSIGSQLIQLTSTWQKKTVTVNIPSIISKSIGTDGVNTSYTELNFWFDAGTTYNTRTASLGQQSGTFDIAQVQIEEGSVTTPFENRPYDFEKNLIGASDASKTLGFNSGGLSIGVGQTWRQMAIGTERIESTDYYNTTGKPIFVLIRCSGNTAASSMRAEYFINGVSVAMSHLVDGNGAAWYNYSQSISFMVPHGDYYKVVVTGGVATTWSELR